MSNNNASSVAIDKQKDAHVNISEVKFSSNPHETGTFHKPCA